MGKRIVLKNEFLTVDIDSYGAELKSIKDKNSEERLWQGNEKYWKDQAPLLWPICGKLTDGKYIFNGKTYDMPGHGFGKRSEFAVESSNGISATFLLKSSDVTKKVYPFDFELRVIYALDKNRINVTYAVNNATDGDIYFSIGSHEGFFLNGKTEDSFVCFENISTLENSLLDGPFLSGKTEKTELDGGKLFLDDTAFSRLDTYVFENIGQKRVTLGGKNTDKKITVDFPETPHLLLWKEPGADFLCIEPWCALPDMSGVVSNLPEKMGINKLEKNGVFKNTHTITIH